MTDVAFAGRGVRDTQRTQTMHSPRLPAVLLSLLLVGSPALAQTVTQGGSGTTPSTTQEEGAVLQLTPEKMDAFARAVLAVNRVSEEWQPRIAGAADRQQALTLARLARKEMEIAVDKEPGISLTEYAAIATAARKNAELAQALQDRLQAIRPSGS